MPHGCLWRFQNENVTAKELSGDLASVTLIALFESFIPNARELGRECIIQEMDRVGESCGAA